MPPSTTHNTFKYYHEKLQQHQAPRPDGYGNSKKLDQLDKKLKKLEKDFKIREVDITFKKKASLQAGTLLS